MVFLFFAPSYIRLHRHYPIPGRTVVIGDNQLVHCRVCGQPIIYMELDPTGGTVDHPPYQPQVRIYGRAWHLVHAHCGHNRVIPGYHPTAPPQQEEVHLLLSDSDESDDLVMLD